MEKLGSRIDGVRSIELDNAFYIEDGKWIESLTISSTTDFDPHDAIADIWGVRMFYTHEIPTGPSEIVVRRLTLVANESYPFILGLVLRHEAIPNRIVLQGNEFEVVVTARNWESFRALADDLEESLGAFELQSVSQIENPGEPLDGGRITEVITTKLADEQLAVLETAYELGYFDVPRTASTNDIAGALDVSQSTASERLRVAERNLLALLYGSRKE
ncbi:helix-turn-helix domain-containing protein [Halococcus morrhuae DSM 1307]|uniref:Helix-turn-helix domain-containing protein n=1 Tax=Halococcus dombrowskii TaxID=179637 RepID=A0AAV3SF01_HALDO|nr:helix-turn-helix domain-containing protein [Halococcus dombrowskii]UOO95027.1 helix-turn-helix domain-containing protein [Halococcus dombrowskii]